MSDSIVRAKFKVTSNTACWGDQIVVGLIEVCDPDDKNKEVRYVNPLGEIKIWIADAEEAKREFEIGKDYYVDFTPV